MKDVRAQYLEYNLLPASQVCTLLGISKTQLTRIVEAGHLPIGFSSSQGNLFFRDKVEDYLHTKQPHVKIEESTHPVAFLQKTRFDVDEFLTVIGKLGRIVRIHVYYDDVDAALDGFYQVRETPSWWSMIPAGGLPIHCPRVVLIDEHGRELWSLGGSTGYQGAGTNNSVRMLRWLGQNTPMHPLDEDDLKQLYAHRIIEFVWSENHWVVIGKDSGMSPQAADTDYDLPGGQLMEHNGHLALFQRRGVVQREVMVHQLIEHYRFFIPDPVTYRYLSKEQAPVDSTTGQQYSLIIQDKSGRELWLLLHEDWSQAERSQTVHHLLTAAGLHVDPSELQSSRIKQWISKLLTPFKGGTRE